jgi:hypothetical protein
MTLEFSDRFSKNAQKSNLMKICIVGAELFDANGQTGEQTDMTKLAVAFHSFSDIRKKEKGCMTYLPEYKRFYLFRK